IHPGWPELAVQVQGALAVARAVELDSQHRLPATHDQPPFFDEQRQKAGEEQLAAVRVAVHRFVDRDLEAAREVVVLVAGVARREALEQMLEITKQQRLVLVDREAEGGMQRLQMNASGPQAGSHNLVADPLGEVDELGGVRSVEPQASRDHLPAANAWTSRSRTGRER